jgi:hypothetical protein
VISESLDHGVNNIVPDNLAGQNLDKHLLEQLGGARCGKWSACAGGQERHAWTESLVKRERTHDMKGILLRVHVTGMAKTSKNGQRDGLAVAEEGRRVEELAEPRGRAAHGD